MQGAGAAQFVVGAQTGHILLTLDIEEMVMWGRSARHWCVMCDDIGAVTRCYVGVTQARGRVVTMCPCAHVLSVNTISRPQHRRAAECGALEQATNITLDQ